MLLVNFIFILCVWYLFLNILMCLMLLLMFIFVVCGLFFYFCVGFSEEYEEYRFLISVYRREILNLL